MKNYQPWYEKNPQRFEEEKADMEKRGFVLNDEALLHHQRVEFTGRSAVDPSLPLVVKYPGEFPSLPPRIYSQTPGRSLLRHHNPATGEICLFGPGQPRWSASEDGVKAIDEAESIIRQYSPGNTPVSGDDVPEPVSALFVYAEDAAVIVPPELASPDPAATGEITVGTFRLRFNRKQGGKPNRFTGGRGVVLSTRIGGRSTQAGVPYRNWCQSRGQEERNGTLVLLPESPPLWQDSSAFYRWLADIKVTRVDWMAFVFPEQSQTASQRRLAWLLVRTYNPLTPMHLIRTFPYRPDEREARVPGLGGLADKKVVFIGCGSMGSKIAVPLAATGLNRYGLIDGDIIKPENAVRHEVGVEWFGSPKVVALFHRLASVNPTVMKEVIPDRDLLGGTIGGAGPIEWDQKLLNLISSADLVVETTGSHGVSRWVNDICHDLGIPALYATVTNGAWGGEIVRVIPGRTACWRCWFSQYENDRPPAAPAPASGIFAPGCDQPTFTGASFDLGVVANLAAWVAVETLLRDEAGRKDFTGDYIRWAARLPDGTPKLAPEVLQVNKRQGCQVCNPG